MNKIKSLMNKIKTVVGDAIISYHAKIAYMSLDEIELAKLDGDDKARVRWEKHYSKVSSSLPLLKFARNTFYLMKRKNNKNDKYRYFLFSF